MPCFSSCIDRLIMRWVLAIQQQVYLWRERHCIILAICLLYNYYTSNSSSRPRVPDPLNLNTGKSPVPVSLSTPCKYCLNFLLPNVWYKSKLSPSLNFLRNKCVIYISGASPSLMKVYIPVLVHLPEWVITMELLVSFSFFHMTYALETRISKAHFSCEANHSLPISSHKTNQDPHFNFQWSSKVICRVPSHGKTPPCLMDSVVISKKTELRCVQKIPMWTLAIHYTHISRPGFTG